MCTRLRISHGPKYSVLTFVLDSVATGMFVDLVNWKLASDAWLCILVTIYEPYVMQCFCSNELRHLKSVLSWVRIILSDSELKSHEC